MRWILIEHSPNLMSRDAVRVAIVRWAAALMLLSSSIGTVACSHAATCVPGMTVACACSGGVMGVQVCESSGAYGMCNCPDTDAGGALEPQVDAGTFDGGQEIDGGSTTDAGLPDGGRSWAPCPATANLAVITGGEAIEGILQRMGYTPTIFDGTPSGFDGPDGGLQFLKDPAQLAKYSVIFIADGAGRTPVTQPNGKTYDEFDFGADASTIADNLRQYVQHGGSLFATDWAFIYVFITFNEFHWPSAESIAFPYDPEYLTGYVPQDIIADIVDPGLASYLGTTHTQFNIPTSIRHWGLMDMVSSPATTLISGAVQACAPDAMNSCQTPTLASTEPLAALLRVTNGPGGAVLYTSINNDVQADQVSRTGLVRYMVCELANGGPHP